MSFSWWVSFRFQSCCLGYLLRVIVSIRNNFCLYLLMIFEKRMNSCELKQKTVNDQDRQHSFIVVEPHHNLISLRFNKRGRLVFLQTFNSKAAIFCKWHRWDTFKAYPRGKLTRCNLWIVIKCSFRELINSEIITERKKKCETFRVGWIVKWETRFSELIILVFHTHGLINILNANFIPGSTARKVFCRHPFD